MIGVPFRELQREIRDLDPGDRLTFADEHLFAPGDLPRGGAKIDLLGCIQSDIHAVGRVSMAV